MIVMMLMKGIMTLMKGEQPAFILASVRDYNKNNSLGSLFRQPAHGMYLVAFGKPTGLPIETFGGFK